MRKIREGGWGGGGGREREIKVSNIFMMSAITIFPSSF